MPVNYADYQSCPRKFHARLALYEGVPSSWEITDEREFTFVKYAENEGVYMTRATATAMKLPAQAGA